MYVYGRMKIVIKKISNSMHVNYYCLYETFDPS